MDNRGFKSIFVAKSSFYLWVNFIFVVLIAFYDIRVAVPGFLLLIILVFYTFRSNYLRQKEMTKYIENLTFNIDTATKDTLLNFPMPLVLLEIDGTIIWYNSSFRKIFDGEELLEKTISTFIHEINTSDIASKGANISKEIVINNRNYSVLGNLIKSEDKADSEFIYLLYLVDNTELVQFKKQYKDEKVVTGVIVIDNYDDLMQSMPDSARPQMMAEIEKKLFKWVEFTHGIIRKYERDKYLFIFEYRFFKDFVKNKYDILDSVKTIEIGNKIPVTLSMGFGINGQTFEENFNYARASLDIALGRGGDQVVIKNGTNISFFGGQSREFEKKTKVKARVIAFALRELIDQSKNVLIMGHENGDNDSFGASLGVYRIAKNRNKQVNIVLNQSNTTIKSLIDKIEILEEYTDAIIDKNEALDIVNSDTLLVVVDTHRPSFTECPELLQYTQNIVVIDHHRRGAEYLKDAVLSYHETYASSTCELVTEILQYVEEKVKLNPIESEALYAGIVVDTKNFTFKTGVRTFEAAAFLRRQGVDTISVKQLFQNDFISYVNRSNVVRDAEILDDNIAISICPSNLDKAQLVAAQAADDLLNLKGVIAAFVLGYGDNEIFISGRSLGDINVQVILEKLGGGGQMTVAGAQIKDISIEKAKEKLKYAIMEYIQETNREE